MLANELVNQYIFKKLKPNIPQKKITFKNVKNKIVDL